MCKLSTVTTNYGEKIHVAEIKKDYIDNIIHAAGLCEKIDEIILFGSSIEERCTANSDIDIAVISNVSRSKLFSDKSYRMFQNAVYHMDILQNYDILQFNSLRELKEKKSPVCGEISSKGKSIYRRCRTDV